MADVRLMYFEPLSAGPVEAARIGLVRFSEDRQTAHYAGRRLRRDGDHFRDESTGERFIVRHPDPAGYEARQPRPLLIDEDARLPYWRDVRGRVLAMAAV